MIPIEVPTFLAAGHETTATATGWLLCELAKNPDLQQKLREELFSVETDTPTMEELNELPYLDKVVRETLRLHPPVTMTTREVQCDDVIPVSEPFLDARGKLQQLRKESRQVRLAIRQSVNPLIALATTRRVDVKDRNSRQMGEM